METPRVKFSSTTLISLSAGYHRNANVPACSSFGRTVPEQLTPKKDLSMREVNDVAGTAALSICESLLLAMNDRKILPETEIVGLLRDAAAAHSNDTGEDGKADLHKAVAELINGIITGGNSVRRR
jgi:hypothetical protein